MSVLVLYHGPTWIGERLSSFPDFDCMFEDIDRADREMHGGRRVYMLPAGARHGHSRTVKVFAAETRVDRSARHGLPPA